MQKLRERAREDSERAREAARGGVSTVGIYLSQDQHITKQIQTYAKVHIYIYIYMYVVCVYIQVHGRECLIV